MKRGVIVSDCELHAVENGVNVYRSLTDVHLNYYLLYWDKILMPIHPILHVKCHNEEQLVKSGCLERPIVDFDIQDQKPVNYSDPVIRAQSILANKVFTEKSDIDFTLHQIGNTVVIADAQKSEFNSIKVELLNCLPVPLKGVNFQEILEFKVKRESELVALHSSIDTLYKEILVAPDKSLQSKIEISDLKVAINDLNKCFIEKFKDSIMFKFSTELNINLDPISAVKNGVLIYGVGVPLDCSLVYGVISSVKIEASNTTSVKSAKDKLKLNYLAEASNRNIVKA